MCRGLPDLHEWLWSEEARQRHKLPQSSQLDRSVVTEAEFLAFVAEHPLLQTSLHTAGARAMFHRYVTGNASSASRSNAQPSISVRKATELDQMIFQVPSALLLSSLRSE
jgi:hypothetical protein